MNKLLSLNGLDRILKNDDQDIARCERKGSENGKANIPANSIKSLSKFEIDEKSKVEKAIQKLSSEVDLTSKQLDNQRTEILRKLDIQIPKNQDETDALHQDEVDQIEKLVGQNSTNQKDISNKLEIAHSTLRTIKIAVNNRPLSVQFVGPYITFMLALAFAEVWVNRLAFELFFESTPLVSLFLATAIGAMLVFFAHVTGSAIKRSQSTEVPVAKSKTFFSMGILNVLVVVFIFYLAKMRQAFVSISTENEAGLGGLENLLNTPEIPELSALMETNSMMDSLVSANLGQEGIFLLLVNVAVYVCGFIAAFIRHDTHPDYEKAENEYNKHRAALVKATKSFDSKVATIDKRKSDLHSNIRKDRDIAEEQLYKIDQEINDIQQVLGDHKTRASEVVTQRISIYRKANLANRSKPAPPYFNENIEFNWD
jgi:hypothetical protein